MKTRRRGKLGAGKTRRRGEIQRKLGAGKLGAQSTLKKKIMLWRIN